jgi:hypothetical protein
MDNKTEQIKALIREIALTEEFVRSDENYPSGSHVCLVFSDGELSSTKAGSLLHQRNLHCFHSGDESKKVSDDLFPQKMGKHGYVFCDHEKGKQLRNLILS